MDSNKKSTKSAFTAHDWEYYKRRNKEVTDDQTMSFFWFVCLFVCLFKKMFYFWFYY